jgi:hypothetical protein
MRVKCGPLLRHTVSSLLTVALAWAQSGPCMFNVTLPEAVADSNGVVQWLSDLDQIGTDHYRVITAVHSLDKHARSIIWRGGGLRVKSLKRDILPSCAGMNSGGRILARSLAAHCISGAQLQTR